MSRLRLQPSDPGWPPGLSDLGQLAETYAVRSLWLEGELPVLPGVAVVGARRAGASGQEEARRIGADLGRRGVTVVSGFARGVDAGAHRGCLAAGGRTLAVLGCGLDVEYPSQHAALRRDVAASGALITEYEAGDPPVAWRFPQRNRIIAALSLAVVVVEAGVESGALSTARWAAELGREVLAVPGAILGPGHQGSNRLLRDGARPYLDSSDLADLFPECGAPPPLSGDGKVARERDARPSTAADRGTSAARLLALIGVDPVPRELVARDLGLGASDLAVLLGELELVGSVRCLPGGLVARAAW